MGHDYIQIDNSQARSIEKYLQEDSFSFLSFIVNCVSGTFLGLLSLVNILFYGLCNLVFKCFKIIDLVFKIIGSFMSFLRSLLQFNYHLVTQGFTILGEILSTLVLNFQVGCTSLVGLVISFVHSIINLPFSIATITWYYAGFLRENCHKLILVTYKLYQLCFDVIASCANVITNVIAKCVTISLEGVNTILKKCSFAIFQTLEIATKTSEFVVGLLKILGHNIWSFVYNSVSMAASAIMLLLQHINTGLYSIWLSVIDVFEATLVIFERLGTFIAMPFSLANIKFLLGSIFALFQNVIHILLGIVYFFYGLFQHLINFIRESVLDAASCFIGALKTLAEPSAWIILFIPTCLLVTYLIRESFIIRQLEALGVKLFQTVCSYVNGEHNAPNAQAAQNRDGPDQNRRNDLQNDNNLQRRNNFPQDPILNGQNDLQRGNNEERENVVQRRGNQLPSGDAREHDDNIKDAVPPPNVPQDDERHLCIVCQDNDRTTVLLPCRHLCLCHDCALTLRRYDGRRRTCPLCRHQIQDILNVYL